MKVFTIVAAAALLLVAGCRKAEEKKTMPVPVAVGHLERSETNQRPYYYGLIEEYRTILAEDPNNLAAIIGLGNAYSETASWSEAIHYYEQALKLDPKNADVRSDMGTAYRNIGMPDRALSEYRLALQHQPGNLNARYNMGIVYAFDLRDYKVAIHLWENILRIAPNHPQSAYMRTCIASFRKTLRKGHP